MCGTNLETLQAALLITVLIMRAAALAMGRNVAEEQLWGFVNWSFA
jgi:hypothetical protein